MSRPSSQKARSARILANRAAKHPGVAELVEVYDAWRKYEKATAAHDLFKGTKQRTCVSSSSGPLLREEK